ncbi:hypothetical protein ACHAQH_001701 [Verticillium albo-atrum]
MESVVASRPTLPALDTGGHDSHHAHHGHARSNSDYSGSAPATFAAKKRGSFLSKTFKSFSSLSSLELTAEEIPSGSKTPPRRVLTKTPTRSSSIFHRISRRASKDSNASSHTSETSGKLATMKVIKHGPLKTDAKLWKSRAEYVVLTETCLLKFNSIDAARATFIEIGGQTNRLSRTSTTTSLGQDTASGEPSLQIPLRRIINIFNEEGSSPHFGLDVWWSEAPPAVSWANNKLFFGLPQERNEWMVEIRQAIREFVGRSSVPGGIVASNVEARIYSLVAAEEPMCQGYPLDIFPVVQRTFQPRAKSGDSDTAKKLRDASSYYLLLGLNKCYLVRVSKTSAYKAPQDLEINTVVFGITSLVRLKATMVPHEERFVLGFRMPCEPEKRLELASRWYREIVMTFMKADRAVKPAWPQHLQNDIFEIKGLTAQLHLPSGQDFGGLKRTLEAYCATYRCQVPDWTANWKCERREHSPEFRLLPSRSADGYSAFQLLAVFRALRYNDYFKSLSFRDVDFSSMCNRYDLIHYDDSIADVSRNGYVIDSVHREILRSSPMLFQEIHAIAFTSGSIRSIDLTNVLAPRRIASTNPRARSLHSSSSNELPEIARPILLLLRTQNITLDALIIGGNALTQGEVDELVTVLNIPDIFRHLDISRCSLDERSLEEIWDALPEQSYKMEVLDTSRNFGNVDHVLIRNSLSHFARLRKLSIAGNCMSQFTDFLFYDETIMRWQLEELDLSDVKLSDETTMILAAYLEMPESSWLRRLELNNCGLSGSMAATLFRSMGQGRQLICAISGNHLEDGGDDLANAIGYNFGPRMLFIDMVEYREENNFIKLIRALAVNNTVNLLSLVGTSTAGQVSEEACAAVSDFFATNDSVRYLDFSGFSAKLDEGQLGLGFSRSLAGLAKNTTIHHLRIRNQKLNVNIGDLASAIARNATLKTLDVQDNGFNLSNLTHMARSLEENDSVQEFRPFSEAELNRTINSSMQKVILPSHQPEPHRRRSSKAAAAARAADTLAEDASKALVQELRGQWTVKMDQIEAIVERNRARADIQQQGRTQSEHTSEQLSEDLSALFGGLAVIKRERKTSVVGSGPPTPPLDAVDDEEYALGTAPHHVTRDEVLESPASDTPGGGSSGLPTPPEWAAGEGSIQETAGSAEALDSFGIHNVDVKQ